MSSPVPEVLVQDNLTTDLFKTISESVDASNHVIPDVTSVSCSDDVISHLLDRMIQILPPEERDIFGCTDEKNIEDIIEEANELIRATTPLFSSTDSGEKSWSKTSKTLMKTSKSSEPSSKKDNSVEVPSKEKSGGSSIYSSLESILEKDSVSHTTPERQEQSMLEKPEVNEEMEANEVYSKMINNNNTELLTSTVEKLIEDSLGIVKDHSLTDKENTNKNSSNDVSKNVKSTLLSSKTSLDLSNIVETKISKTTEEENENNSIMPQQVLTNNYKESESKLESIRQKYVSEVQDLKLSHNKEIYGLTKQITSLNDKIFELQKHLNIQKSPESKNHEIDRLESELKSQEQLMAGYEQENQKLCKEISSLKEAWKQKEIKLIEEKQRLQNELQGMVTKVTTEALEEQLKDARETIVKLQIELTTYKGKNKELEATCERLRNESHNLQRELNNCHCDRKVGCRDRYSFLASSNVGTQIQELKNVITRKDVEIAQLSTTLSIMKGELSNRDVPFSAIVNNQNQQLDLTISQLQTSLAVERQNNKDLLKEKEQLIKENLDLKRQVRELESIVKRRHRSESCFPVTTPDSQSATRLVELERELSTRQESLSNLHSQFFNMQKKYEQHIEELEKKLKECREELQTLKDSKKKEDTRLNVKKFKQGTTVVKEETHLLATIRGLRQEAAARDKEMSKLHKEIEEVRLTNKRLQKEREKQLNSMPIRATSAREKGNLRKVDKASSLVETRSNRTSPNNNLNPIMFTELQDANLILKSKVKTLQEEVKRLEQDLIAMHNKRVHDDDED